MSEQRRVLLLGAGGQLGTELQLRFRDLELVAFHRGRADLSRPESLRDVVRAISPQIILNAAAYTAVDRAESEPELADAVNHRAPAVLAEEAERSGALLVHYSTDYVFDGSKGGPWVETDAPAPLNVYGASKLAGELAIAARCSRYVTLRTSWVYAGHGQNFLRTMLRLGAERDELRVVDDQYGAPTSAAALAQVTRRVVDEMIENRCGSTQQWAGVYHATCAGQTTWRRFAEAIFAAYTERWPGARVPRVEAIASEAYPTPACRPKNSMLDNGKLWRRFGVRLPAWEHELRVTVAALWSQDA